MLQVATDGNWMHIHFQSKIQARKALSKNGKVFGTGVMVGVHQCIDKVMFTFISVYRVPQVIEILQLYNTHTCTHIHTLIT